MGETAVNGIAVSTLSYVVGVLEEFLRAAFIHRRGGRIGGLSGGEGAPNVGSGCRFRCYRERVAVVTHLVATLRVVSN
jgi:hypothetical protein